MPHPLLIQRQRTVYLMKLIRRFIALLLCTVSLITVTACSSATVYPEEKEINSYVNEMTKGYTQYPENPTLKAYTLYEVEKVLTVKLKQGLNSAPSFEITTGKNKKKTNETEIISVYATVDGVKTKYGSASALSQYFDPYRNTYVPCMRVYQKDEKNFRALFFIINENSDFFPFYLAFTEEGYQQALMGVVDYVKKLERTFSSYDEETQIPDYLTEFKSMFIKASDYKDAVELTYGEKFKNLQETNAYVLYALGPNYITFIDEIFPQYASIDMQYMRSEYEKLGYTGYNPNIIIVTADITVSEDGTSVSVTMNDNVYYSAAAKASGAEYTFEFCPTLSGKGE